MNEERNRIKNERLFKDIEQALATMHRKDDPSEQMKKLRTMFPSPVYFLESNELIKQKAGLKPVDAFYFSILPELARYTVEDEYAKSTRMNHLSIMADYLVKLYRGIHRERFYAVMLDHIGRKKRTILISKGSAASAMFDLRLLLSSVVTNKARAVVLCHNHPRGTMRPSEEDVQCTLRAIKAMKALGVPLLDHIIVAYDHALSIRDIGCIPAELWLLQAPRMKLHREWIDIDLLEKFERETRDDSQHPPAEPPPEVEDEDPLDDEEYDT